MTAMEMQVIDACKAGDRQAFAEIVERYYRLICTVAYSATGDVALSEDLCQETFLTAWRKLNELREPGKLRPWLCGIARNLARNAGRARQARPITHDTLRGTESLSSLQPTPEQQAITREEEDLLWRSLHQIPEDYREPLVLFYRQEKSVTEVAEAMDLSEDAVRQRLSRGRKMLEEHVAGFVETALRRSAPSKVLLVAIVAALPAAVPQLAAASVGAVAAKGSATANAAITTGLAGAIFGPLLGLLGAYIGIRASLKGARSPRERACIVRMTWLCAAYVALFAAVMVLGPIYVAPALSPRGIAVAIVAIIVAYCTGLLILILHSKRRIEQIQREDGTSMQPILAARPMQPGGIIASLGGGIFGCIAWIVVLGVMSRDWPTIGVTLTVPGILLAIAAAIVIRVPQAYFRVAAVLSVVIGAMELLMLNLRWPALKAAAEAEIFLTGTRPAPLWLLNVLIGVIFAAVFAGLLILERRRRKLS